MEQGTIQKMFDYYFTKPKFRDEILRALREFFNKPDLTSGSKLEMEKGNEGMFNEWFIFDFKLSNGKTSLEDFYNTNPYNFDPARLQLYKDLQENHFGLYEVKNIRLGEGLTLENLQTGKIYQVREYSATFGLKMGQVFSARVGKIDDHYELVGSNVTFGPVKLDAALKNIFRKDKNKLNPKILRDSFLGHRKPENPLKNFSSLQEAEEDLKKVLRKYNLDQFVNTATIKEWIYNHSRTDSSTFELNLLCSLLYPDMKDYHKALVELLESFNTFYNLCPQKELGGKSPFEKRKELDKKGIPPDLKMSCQPFPPINWGKKYGKALKYMKKAEFKKALKNFNEVFAYLLEHKITYPEIYRVYTNKGVCHLALGETEIGEFMLKISIAINHFYNFARRRLERYKKGKYGFVVRKKKRREDISQDIGYQYYQFLKPLKINFAHIVKETLITNIKIKRQENKKPV